MIYALLGIAAAFCAFIQWGDEIPLPHADVNKKDAKYVLDVKKQDEKDKHEKTKVSRNPSGYMTVEEYEALSVPKDRMTMEVEVPKIPTPADMAYVPQPSYKIVKYNNPAGSPEISLGNSFHKRRQQNAQGIVSPDFTRLVYPAVYYYPNSASTACDLFVIKLEEAKSNKDRILTANTVHRLSEPILSTDKTNDNYYTFRTLTPVDFNPDGTKLLVKEKIGNSKEGIWKTTPYVYDFTVNLAYNLEDVRNAITYYWKSTKNLNLDDKRWDIIPLGFSESNSDEIVVNAIAYTGDVPVNLGTWAISAKGERPHLTSPTEISMNGFKLIKDGVEPPSVSEQEAEKLRKIEKEKAKQKKKDEKNELKELDKAYKTKLKELDTEYKDSQKDYQMRQRINGSTSTNDVVDKYNEAKEQMEAKRQLELEKQKEKELRKIEKQKEPQ